MTTSIDRLHREGRADAAVLLVARRVVPTMVLTDWARHLELDQLDLSAAVDRFKGRVPKKKPKRTGGGGAVRGDRNLPCGHPGCEAIFDTAQGRGAHRRIHQTEDCGWCGVTFIKLGIGPHRRSCPKRPA